MSVKPSEKVHMHGAPAKKLTENEASRLADFFKALGDPTRIKLLYLLVQREHCVIEIAESLGTSVSAISHQLRLLREARLVKRRREGKHFFYSLDDEHVQRLLQQGIEHISHN